MYIDILKNIGLSGVNAEILSFLMQNSWCKAQEIATKTKRPRGVVYKGMDELIEMGLAEKKDETGKVSVFRAEHPSKLEQLFEEKERSLERDKEHFHNNLPDLVSSYNLAHQKPGVRFYEGDAGIANALADTLVNTKTIRTFADVTTADKTLTKINSDYVKQRERKGIFKKIIVADTPEARNHFSKHADRLTEIRFMDPRYASFMTATQIYGGRISYQSLAEEKKIAVIIEDENIFKSNKLLFDFIWDSLEEKSDKHQISDIISEKNEAI